MISAIPDWLKFILILIIFFIIYVIFMVINYNKIKNEVLDLQNSLQVKDYVVTQAGIYGEIQVIEKGTVNLKIAENTIIKIDRFTIKRKINTESSY